MGCSTCGGRKSKPKPKTTRAAKIRTIKIKR